MREYFLDKATTRTRKSSDFRHSDCGLLVSGLFLCLIFLLWLPATAFATGCSNPSGNESDLIYNGDHHVMQYCDGTVWRAMGRIGGGDAASDLMLWWKFDDGSGTGAADSTGNGWTGTLTNAPTWGTGINGGDLTFNGTSQCVGTNSASFNVPTSNSFTFAAWVKPDPSSTSSNNALISQPTGGAGQVWELHAGGGWADLYTGGGFGGWLSGQPSYTGSDALTSGVWSHVAVTGTGTTTTLYINGVQVASANASAFAGIYPTNNLFVGCANGNYYKGSIDDPRVYNRALSAADVKALYLATGGTTPAAGDITTALAGYWKLDDGSGTTAIDSASTHNGTLTNSPTWTTAGKINDALIFNGTNSYVSMGNITTMNGLTAFTVSAWVKSSAPGANPSEAHFIDKSNCDGVQNGGPFELLVPSGGVPGFAIYPNGGVPAYYEGVNALTSVDDGNWHLVLGEFDGTTESVWVDGAMQGSSTAASGRTLSTNANVAAIGGYCGGQNLIWHGTIDEVRFYTRALSANDIATLYGSVACSAPTGKEGDMMYNNDHHVMQYCDGNYWQPMGKIGGDPSSGLTAYWKFDEASGTNAADSSGNGHNATLNGGMTLQPAAGKIAGDVQADGSTGYVLTPSIDLTGTQAITVSMWVNRTYGGTLGPLMEATTNFNNTAPTFAIFADDSADCGVQAISVNSHGTGIYNSKCYTEPSSGAWHMLTAVLDNTQAVNDQVSFYIDGVPQSTINWINQNNLSGSNYGNNALYLMARLAGSLYIAGTIDDVRIYSRALSATDVLRLYNNSNGGANKVFVTSAAYNGAIGSVAAANTLCATRATAGGLSGTYKAWLSVTSSCCTPDDPAFTFTQSSTPYKGVDGTVIANNWTGLISGTLINPITLDETGTSQSGVAVWTNVATNGTPSNNGSSTSANCAAWTSSTLGNHGDTGLAGTTSSTWTANVQTSCSSATAHLYCFQQDGATVAATCTNPPGNEGDLMYNSNTTTGIHVMQYCDGIQWQTMKQ